MSAIPSDEYIKQIERFDAVLRQCFKLSRRCAGIPAPSGAHYFASVLFTALCTRGMSFGILAPATAFAKKAVDHWDYASLAVLARSILEIRLAFFYLCVEECEAVEWDCRWNLFNLHDCTARIRLFREMDRDSADIGGFESQAEELRERLRQNAFFVGLRESEQRRLLRGRHAYLAPLEEIGAEAGVAVEEFRWLYIFLSNHVHGLPLSFYRMGHDQERGRGIHSPAEDDYSYICVHLVVTLLEAARDEMQALYAPHIQAGQEDCNCWPIGCNRYGGGAMSDRDTEIRIDEDADWTSAGGHYRSGDRPTAWKKKQSGAWDRKELVPYGKASSAYREQYFRCPECDSRLLPTNVQYRFGCEGCGLVFGTGWGGLWGYPPDHPKAMWLTDRS